MIIAKRPRRYESANARHETMLSRCCITCVSTPLPPCPWHVSVSARLIQLQSVFKLPVPAPHCSLSQRSLHNAPICRLLLKVAVHGTHQCDFINFCGAFGSQLPPTPGSHVVLTGHLQPTRLRSTWRLRDQALRRLVFVLT